MSETRAIQTEAILTRFSSRVDGALSFSGVTPELTTPEKVALIDLHNKNVILLIQPRDAVEAPMMNVKGVLDFKSPGQRLRDVLFVLFRQEKPIDTNFDSFYTSYMERVIDRVKEKLNPE